jgi:hypothetical protein
MLATYIIGGLAIAIQISLVIMTFVTRCSCL